MMLIEDLNVYVMKVKRIKLKYSGLTDDARCKYCEMCHRDKDSFFGYCECRHTRVVLSQFSCFYFHPRPHVQPIILDNQLDLF